MKLLVENHGLSWIAVQVFGYLDNKSLTTARLVKSSWRNLIDEKLLELRKQQQEKIRAKIEELKSQFRQSFNFEKWPEWNGIFKDFKNNRNLQDVTKFCAKITYYTERFPYFNYEDPLMHAAELYNDIEMFELVLPSVNSLRYTDRKGRSVFYIAAMYGRLEIVKLILTKYPHLIDFWQETAYGGRNVLYELEVQIFFKPYKHQTLRLLQKFARNLEFWGSETIHFSGESTFINYGML